VTARTGVAINIPQPRSFPSRAKVKTSGGMSSAGPE
jgi:hypothetical protein